MITPIRIQRKRTKGYDMQKESRAVNGLEAISVTRPGQYGNPFKVGVTHQKTFRVGTAYGLTVTAANCIEAFESYVQDRLKVEPSWLNSLRGKNLACFCPLSSPCHADILLKLLSEVPSL